MSYLQVEWRNAELAYEKNEAILKNLNLQIKKGDFIAILGLSGVGKTTLMKSFALLVPIKKGQIYFHKKDFSYHLTQIHNRNLSSFFKQAAFIFQSDNLVENISVIDNVLLAKVNQQPFWRSFLGLYEKETYERAYQILEKLGLGEKASTKTSLLSGGQKQRLAIAKALMQEASLIWADEPTANLDRSNSELVLNIFTKINKDLETTIILNMHDVELALKYARRIVALKDGEIFLEKKSQEITQDELVLLYKLTDRKPAYEL